MRRRCAAARSQGEELCEIAGVGPVPVSVAREVLGEAIVKLVITDGVDVANVTHLGRGPTAAQRAALLWTNPTCSVQGCPRQRIEYDHQKPWAQTRHTRLDELDPLCGFHHDLKTRLGYALVPGKGKRAFVAPDDPRHPRYRRAACKRRAADIGRTLGPWAVRDHDPSAGPPPATPAATRAKPVHPERIRRVACRADDPARTTSRTSATTAVAPEAHSHMSSRGPSVAVRRTDHLPVQRPR